jgi:branched-chain amino acid transport system permease protein
MLALALVPVAASLLGQPFYVTLFTRVLVFALAAVSLNLILGFGGLVSFGHAMYMGIGAYAVGILAHHGVHNGWLQLAAGLGAGTVVALAVGSICLRTSGMAFIMITLAFAQMLFFLGISLKESAATTACRCRPAATSGSSAWPTPPRCTGRPGAALAPPRCCCSTGSCTRASAWCCGAAAATSAAWPRWAFPRCATSSAAYVISALGCVVAGMLLANLTRFVAPSYMSWTVSGELIVMGVLGGIGTLFGPVVGAGCAASVLEELLTSLKFGVPMLDRLLNQHWLALIGLFIVAVVLVLKQGLYGAPRGAGRRASEARGAAGRAARQALRRPRWPPTTCRLALQPGELHAIIGPNGAGKTTLISQPVRRARARRRPHRARRRGRHRACRPSGARSSGLGRSYQITSVFPEFSVLQNVSLAVQAHAGHSFRFWRAARERGGAHRAGAGRHRPGGPGRPGDRRVAALSHGQRRQLEIAMTLATGPKLLLLDEPMAGMSHAESEGVVALLRSLKGRYTILLVEHDMDAVFALADRITVLVHGRAIASGTPEEIRASAQVREAYLGDEEAPA